MQQYNIRVTNTWKVVLTIVLVPSLTITPAIILGALYGPVLPDWLQYTIIYALLIACGVATLAIVKRSSPAAIMTLSDDGFSVDFKDKSFLSPSSFKIKISEITNFSIEGNATYDYMSFSTSVRPRRFNISAYSSGDEDQLLFAGLEERIRAMIAAHNDTTSADKRPIATRSMYESGIMKALTAVFLVLMGAVLLNYIFMPVAERVPLWRVALLAVFGLPLTWKVYVNNYMKK